MCIATALAIGSTVFGAVGAIQQGDAQAQSANYQAQVAANNATIARQNATHAAAAEAAQTTQEGLKARQQEAQVRTAFAANNLDVNSGSPADVQTSQRELGDLDVANVANRGAQAVYGYQTQATGYQAQAGLDRATAKNDVTAGYLKAGSLLANAAPSLPNSFSWMGGNPSTGGVDDGEWAE